LGFATIENAIYIAGQVYDPMITYVLTAGGGIAPLRALAGPGHIIYSAIAGYYLGLAKFNPEDAGPIVVKGLVVAYVLHAPYKTAVTNLGAVAEFVGLALDDRDGLEPEFFRGPPASFAGDQFEFVADPADDERLDDAVLADGIDEVVQWCVDEMSTWLKRRGNDVLDGNVSDAR
jgi:hypothetical protein